MPLERDYVLFYGPKEIVEDGVTIRNKVLQPCGCWAAEVYRAPMVYNQTKREFEPGTAFSWHDQTRQCSVHSAQAVVLQLELAAWLAQQKRLLVGQTGNAPPQHVAEDAFFAKLGDGAKRLYADRTRVLAEAEALDEELKALGGAIPRKLQLTDSEK